jgi:GAF domain-containing protein/HAMP domain-containing protein
MLKRLLLIGLIFGTISIISYVLIYLQVQAWQILADAAGVAVGLVLVLQARRKLRRGQLESAGSWTLAAIIVAFGIGEVVWSNNTFLSLIGALALVIIVGSVVRPLHWQRWGVIAVAYAAFILVVNLTQPIARFDISQVPSLSLFAPVIIVILVAVVALLAVQEFRAGSMRLKLVLAFLVISLVSVGAIALYTNLTIRVLLQDQSASELRSVAELQSASIGNLLAKEVELLQTAALDEAIRKQAAASNVSYQGSAADVQASLLTLDGEWLAAGAANDDNAPLIRSKLDNPIADYLREYRAIYPENVEVFVTDRYGALLAATNRTSDYYQADEAWWQAAFDNGQGAIYYALPEYDESSGTYSIDIALPVYERDGNSVVGIMRTTLDLAAVVDLLANTQIGQTGRAEMLLPNNQFVEAAGTQDASPDLLADLSLQPGSVSEVTWGGVPSFAAVALVHSSDPELGSTIDQLTWRIVTHQSRTEILAPAEAQAGIVLFVIAVVAVVVVGASLGLSHLLVRPIAHLTTAANRVREGDLTAQAPVETQDEIGTLAMTFNSMTAQLRDIVGTLEDRIGARTGQLRASADVGRTVASVLEPAELLRSVVNLITDRFGFYYAAIFIIDDTGRYAVLREATGEAGEKLKERGHQLEVNGQSMVGYAITRRRSRIALDVGEDAVRFANPLLPDTRSEIALPLVVGDRVLGALDVQSTQEAAFDEASAAVLQSMADQVAVAWNNALSYTETQAVARRSRALFAASREVGRLQTDLVGTIQSTLHAAADVLDYDRWYVLTFNEIRTTLVPLAAHNWPGSEEALDLQTRVDHPLVYSVQQDAELLINEAFDLRLRSVQVADLRGLISVPIKTRDTIVGVLAFSRTQDPELAEGDLEVGRSLANLIAVAIENYNLVETSQRTLRELDEINRSLTGRSWETIVRRQGQQDVIWYSHSDQLQPQALPEVSEALSQGHIATRLLEDRQQLGVAVPIKLRDVPVGALRLIVPQRTWNTEIAAALDSIAGHIAQAAENARLIAVTEERLTRERALTEATEKVRQRSDVEAILQTAATELARYLNASHIAVRMAPERASSDGDGQ